MENDTFEISPLNERSQYYMPHPEPLLEEQSKYATTPHIVKRATFDGGEFLEDYYSISKNIFKRQIPNDIGLRKRETDDMNERLLNKSLTSLTLEVGLFFDEAAYKIFAPYLNYDDSKLQDMILAYLNGVSIAQLFLLCLNLNFG